MPSTILRKLGSNSRKNRLYQAFRELGHVIRTVFLLQYISDRRLRQQITACTNIVEGASPLPGLVILWQAGHHHRKRPGRAGETAEVPRSGRKCCDSAKHRGYFLRDSGNGRGRTQDRQELVGCPQPLPHPATEALWRLRAGFAEHSPTPGRCDSFANSD